MKKIKAVLKNYLAPFKKVLESVFEAEARVSAFWAKGAHKRLLQIQWGIVPMPEHFNHRIDLFYQWLNSRNPQWVERGVYSGLVLQGGNLLELACGDGFNARNFYSLHSNKVIACDFDPRALAAAKKYNRAQNIEYVLADIRTNMPKGKFENVIFDAAIEHFTPQEIEEVLKNIKLRLTENGILSGHTITQRAGGKHLEHHEYEFKDKSDLLRFFTGHFKHVTVFETVYPGRTNLYFWASDGILPFRDNWKDFITENSVKE